MKDINEKGVMAVEFSLVAILFFAMCLAVVEFGRYAASLAILTQGVQQGMDSVTMSMDEPSAGDVLAETTEFPQATYVGGQGAGTISSLNYVIPVPSGGQTATSVKYEEPYVIELNATHNVLSGPFFGLPEQMDLTTRSVGFQEGAHYKTHVLPKIIFFP